MHATELWSEDALNLFEKLASRASDTYFKQSQDIRCGGISFGEVVVRMDGKEFKVGSELVRLKLAVHVASNIFQRTFNATVASVTERWNDNSRQGGILNTPDFIEVGSIGSKGFQDHPFLFKYFQKRVEQDVIIVENSVATSCSVSKVNQWLERNSGIEYEDTGANTIDIDTLLLNKSRSSTFVSPIIRSRRNRLEHKSKGKSNSPHKKPQPGSDGQQTSSRESEVPSSDKASEGHNLNFDNFLKKTHLEDSNNGKLIGLLDFMKRM